MHLAAAALLTFTTMLLPGQDRPDPSDAARLAAACNEFAAALHARLGAKTAPNAGPASIALALLLLRPGARGDTEQELTAVLRLPDDLRGARLHAAARELLDSLTKVDKGTADAEGPQLRLANDLWTQASYPIVADYARLLRDSYGALHHAVDFVADPDAAMRTINAHVAGVTNQRIPELLTPGLLTPDTRVVLTNAMWLKAAWLHPFVEGSTRPAPFTLADGAAVDVPTMRVSKHFEYAENDDWQCLVMPFAASQLVLELVLPRPGRELAAAERTLLANAHAPGLQHEFVQVHLPRFRVVGAHRLREPLIAMGMPRAFDAARADFTGITAKQELVVAEVVHQTWIQVDEKGAEAAAATAVMMTRTSAPAADQPKVFAADRPFAFVLRDRKTGLVLFVGRVEDPRANAADTAVRPAR